MFFAPRDAKALKCIAAAGEEIVWNNVATYRQPIQRCYIFSHHNILECHKDSNLGIGQATAHE